MKIAVGSILMFKPSVKSKSVLVIPNEHKSGCPHKGSISIVLLIETICGNSFKLVDDLNLVPATCASVALPILTKSCGERENSPMSDKSTSK